MVERRLEMNIPTGDNSELKDQCEAAKKTTVRGKQAEHRHGGP